MQPNSPPSPQWYPMWLNASPRWRIVARSTPRTQFWHDYTRLRGLLSLSNVDCDQQLATSVDGAPSTRQGSEKRIAVASVLRRPPRGDTGRRIPRIAEPAKRRVLGRSANIALQGGENSAVSAEMTDQNQFKGGWTGRNR